MLKYSILVLFGGMILFLGMKIPTLNLFDSRREPVPSSQKVAHSSHCAGCHGHDESGLALVDAEGEDVNIFDDWQISMMGLAARDPFWRATITHEVSHYPSAASEIETICLKCHSPLGSFQSHFSGYPYSYALMLQDSLGLDGVSCSACHQQPSKNLGKEFSGNYKIDTNRIMFGPFPNPFQGPMHIYVGFDPVFSDHIYSSGVCAGCHTLITNTLKEDGTPSGDFFVEQATYHEWLNSVYPAQGKECQICHVPFIKDSIVIATGLQALKKRYPFGLHQFSGANTAMLTLMKSNRDTLHLPKVSSDLEWDEVIENNRHSLSRAATLEITPFQILDDTLYFDITIKNKTGHKFPSGYPNRVAWLQITMTDTSAFDTIYANGLLDRDGNITGRDYPFEPHHEVSNSAEDVQLYEMVMSDLNGNLTTRLNAAYQPLKDNRLLPLGFKRNNSVYDTVAIWGNAQTDPDYDTGSAKGADIITYKIPLNGHSGLARLKISLLYQSLPVRWMNELLSHDSIAQVAQFKSMYQGYQHFAELIDEIEIEDINLSASRTQDIAFSPQILLYPNPGNGNEVQVDLPSKFSHSQSIRFELIDIHGRIMTSGILKNKIQLNPELKSGLYYFVIYDRNRVIGIKPYSLL